jgi:hypothetical protein
MGFINLDGIDGAIKHFQPAWKVHVRYIKGIILLSFQDIEAPE